MSCLKYFQASMQVRKFLFKWPGDKLCLPTCSLYRNRKLVHSGSTNPVKLAYSSYEGGMPSADPPIIILHGLLGSRKNWTSLSKAIQSKTGRKVIVPDARNHGDSPHSDVLNYEVLSNDLIELMKDLELSKAILVGHSMGGRAVMSLALSKPSLVDRLVVVDISPISVSPGAQTMSEFLFAMEQISLGEQLNRTAARKLADEQLQLVVKDNLLRQFLLTNLVEDNGKFRWRVNLRSIISNLPSIIGHFPFQNRNFDGPTLFIGGEKSDYIKKSDHDRIQGIFPAAKFQYIPDAGHWVHSEKPAQFLDILVKFINQ